MARLDRDLEKVAAQVASEQAGRITYGDPELTRLLVQQRSETTGWTIEHSAPLGNVLRREMTNLSETELDAIMARAVELVQSGKCC